MDKLQFIDGLRAALNGRVSPALAEENINYYLDYINVETRKGRTEEEVLASLGDPRLIARTIIQSSGADDDNPDEADHRYGSGRVRRPYDSGSHGIRLQGGLRFGFLIAGGVVAVVLILRLLFFLSPILLVVAAVVFMVKLFRDWLN